jgi:hypothetical protein
MLDKDLKNMVQIQVYVCLHVFGSVKINAYIHTQTHTFSKAVSQLALNLKNKNQLL